MVANHYDIVIIGGGPVGMALSLILHDTGISSLLLEARGLSQKIEDPRPLAISYGSHLILHRLGIWNTLTQKTPITTIHISNRGSFGRTVLTSRDAGVPALGFVINYQELYSCMHQKIIESKAGYISGATATRLDTDKDSGIVYFDYQGKREKVTAKMIALADGGQLVKQIPDIDYQSHDYQQWAVVANVKTEKKQTGIAYERFTSTGPVALLPNQEDFALIWTVDLQAEKEIIAINDKVFLARLHQHFGDRVGNFISIGRRSIFPLILRYATPVAGQRIVLIGNAAQTLHPVAGQGFNLGLRDAYELADEIIDTKTTAREIGTFAMLAKYSQRRKIDSNASRIFTDSLVKIFAYENSSLKIACGLGLSILDCTPFLRRFVSRRMIFGSRE